MLNVAGEASFLLISNIPAQLRSSHLREYFSQFIEKKGFVCFHYRHRPEYLEGQQSGCIRGQDVSPKAAKTNCCVVAVRKAFEPEFLRLYQSKNWIGPSEKMLPAIVKIRKVTVGASHTSATEDSKLSSGSSSSLPHQIPWEELSVLPELTPPSVLPQGNVGTPLSTLMELIRQCKLPARVIKKLGIEFPKSRTRRRYGAVHLDYGTSSTDYGTSSTDDGTSSTDHGTPSVGTVSSGLEGGTSAVNEEGTSGTGRNVENEDDGDGGEKDKDDDGDDVEEWDRYEALHNDVDKQERTEERLQEEELEVVWEKGGSGLVFYTDASYWDQQDGDFDEKCSKEDDWDVDLSGYYSYEGADKDARDLRDMQIQERLRDHGDQLLDSWKIGQFEKHTKGIGSKLLKRSGWKEGSGVGASACGISEPLDPDGQLPQSRMGLGYHGEAVMRSGCGPATKKPRSSKETIISTIYDKQDEELSTPLRTAPPRTIKYREPVKFTEGGILKELCAHKHPTT